MRPARASLGGDGIVLLELPADMLAARRAGGDRQRPARSAQELDREARLEAGAVRGYAAVLDIPLVSARVEGAFRLDPLVDEIVRQRRAGA
jgi:hypothetical protein